MANRYEKGMLLQNTDGDIVRILDMEGNTTDDTINLLLIRCIQRKMPTWEPETQFMDWMPITEETLWETTGIYPDAVEKSPVISKYIQEHYTLIAGILPFIGNEAERSRMIRTMALQRHCSTQTIRTTLCLYLAYQSMNVLAPKQRKEKELTSDEKIMRWALNKFFYTKHQNTLTTAYTMMLKEKYVDGEGNLLPHPSIYQFRYFYKKTKNMQNYYIAREGIKKYQRDYRPLLGEGIQEFASNVGVGMLDSTICDIYLINDSGEVIGRPVLTACIDAYSSLCCGYSLGWEGGTYSLRGLMLNVVTDKVEHCLRHGIAIDTADWDCKALPGTLVTDKGTEYASENFEQLTDFGITIINLPAYRPELKGAVEKFFDLIQNSFKPYLRGKGVIEPDFQERGAHDYRKDACLTLEQFEKILLYCILYYNTKRPLDNFPCTRDMLDKGILPYANTIWEYGKQNPGADLVNVSAKEVMMSLLPRTTGRFTRQGLKVNKLRYRHDNYTEQYLKGGEAIVAYNPDDVSCVWLLTDNGKYVRFELIETRFAGCDLSGVQELQFDMKQQMQKETEANLQAKVQLARNIEGVVGTSLLLGNGKTGCKTTRHIRENRKKEQQRKHRDFVKEYENKCMMLCD